MRYDKYITCLALACICVAGCSEPNKPEDHTGGGIPIPNPSVVSGAVSFEGWPLDKEGVKTVLYRNIIDSTDIRSWPVDTAYTDSTGAFGFDTLDYGCYSIVFEKDAYTAFSGYFDYVGDTIILDTSSLSPALAIAGIMREVEERRVLVGLVGTDDSVVVETDNIFYPEDKFFVFENSAAGDYKTKIVLDYREPVEKRFYVPLPARDVFSRDTSYSDTTFGLISRITIINDMYSMTNMYCRLICFLDEGSNKMANKGALYYKELMENFLKGGTR